MNLTISPAYGREYRTRKEAINAWKAGKDFVVRTPGHPTYCSIRDISPRDSVTIRYNYDRECVVIQPGD